MSGNNVVITGGATGIGFAMAKYLSERDNQVLICGRRADRLDQAAVQLPGVETLRCDVTEASGRQMLAAYVRDEVPGVTMLINNAGIQRDLDLTLGPADFDRGEDEIAVNLEAPILLSALFTPLLTGRPGAAIVNVSSGLAFMVERAARCPVYCATKAGIHAFSIAQRIQLAPLGVRVIEIIPPAVESELNPESRRQRGAARLPYMMAADDFVARAFAQMADDVDEIRVAMEWKQPK